MLSGRDQSLSSQSEASVRSRIQNLALGQHHRVDYHGCRLPSSNLYSGMHVSQVEDLQSVTQQLVLDKLGSQYALSCSVICSLEKTKISRITIIVNKLLLRVSV